MQIVPITIWREAASEEDLGKIAVYHVIMNRAKSNKIWPNDPEKVCLQPYQFSCWNTNDPTRKKYPADATASAIMKLVEGTEDPTHGATYYVNPKVVKDPFTDTTKFTFLVQIGRHKFYKDV